MLEYRQAHTFVKCSHEPTRQRQGSERRKGSRWGPFVR